MLSESKKIMPTGSTIRTDLSQDRLEELNKRKEDVINMINKAYAEQEPGEKKNND